MILDNFKTRALFCYVNDGKVGARNCVGDFFL